MSCDSKTVGVSTLDAVKHCWVIEVTLRISLLAYKKVDISCTDGVGGGITNKPITELYGFLV